MQSQRRVGELEEELRRVCAPFSRFFLFNYSVSLALSLPLSPLCPSPFSFSHFFAVSLSFLWSLSLFSLSLCVLSPTAVETLLFTTTAITQTRAQYNTQVQHLQRQQSCLVSYLLKVIYEVFSFFSCRKKNVGVLWVKQCLHAFESSGPSRVVSNSLAGEGARYALC